MLPQRSVSPIPPTPSSSSPKKACGLLPRPWHPILRCGVADRLSPWWPPSDPTGVYTGLINNSGWQVSREEANTQCLQPGRLQQEPVSHCRWGAGGSQRPRWARSSELGAQSSGPRLSCRSCAPGPCGCSEWLREAACLHPRGRRAKCSLTGPASLWTNSYLVTQ